MKRYYIPAVLMGLAAIVQPQFAQALNQAQIRDAESMTVLINENNRAKGSGVIIAQEESTYYVVTAGHVVNNLASQYQILTFDKKPYQIDADKIIKLPGVDLAILQFTSQATYKIAELGLSEPVTKTTNVYVSGYPGQESTGIVGQHVLTPGQINTIESVDGVPIFNYSNATQPGMSGGAVLNENGKVVAIHLGAVAERTRDGFTILKDGFNRGIRINKLVELIPGASAEKGKEKMQRQDYRGAIADFSLGLEFNKSAEALIGRGYAYFALGDYNKAKADADAAIALNQQSALAYLLQGASLAQLGKHGEAIRILTRAIQLNGNLADAYGWRAVSRAQNEDISGANKDITDNLRLAPNSPNVYFRRSLIRSLANDSGAAEDAQKARELAVSYRESDPYLMAINLNLNSNTVIVRRREEQRREQPSRPSTGVSSLPNNNSNNENNPPPPDDRITGLPPSDWGNRILNAAAKVVAIALSPDGRILASAIGGGRIQLWDFNTGRALRPIPGQPGVIRGIAFSPDGRQLASGGLNRINIWDVNRATNLREIPLPVGVSVDVVAFSRSGQTVATGMGDGSIKIWQVATAKEWKENFPKHSKAISAMVYSPDGMTIASGSQDGTIKVWSLRRGEVGKVLHNFTEHKDLISAIAFSRDGQTLVSSSVDRTIKIWDLKTNQLRRTIEVGADGVSEVAISPDGNNIASANSRNIRLWNLSDGQLTNTLLGHTGLINSLLYSPDGRLVSGSEDSTIRIWQKK
ncbi:MAG TPA: hypothetical protein DDW76_34720 [Cyanobacteria bacterium UBA11369]|nr:hypothetical protein [Cyanobacteria bacterium UBA11371]HBE34707.1 hypothetical protein [Cyanobacteria bacterium UBA11368]HBE53766.1 hypothetical protein [Cyanobacteria bacterium UBA11369]